MKPRFLLTAAVLLLVAAGVVYAEEWSDVEASRNTTCTNHSPGHSRWINAAAAMNWDMELYDENHGYCNRWYSTQTETAPPSLDFSVTGECSWTSGNVSLQSYVIGFSCEQMYGPMIQAVVPESNYFIEPNGSGDGGVFISISWEVSDAHVSTWRYYVDVDDPNNVVGGDMSANTLMF